jgi:cyanophycin synthetase
MPAGSKRSVVISGAGDRRDEDIRQQTEILGTLSIGSCSIRTSASAAGRTAKCWPAAGGPENAGEPRRSGRSAASSWPSTGAGRIVRAGDLCLILIDQIEEALEHLSRRIAEG